MPRRLFAPLALGLAATLGPFASGPLGAALLYPALGFVPGAVLMRWLPVGRGHVSRTALALALAPLVATLAAWGFVTIGLGLPAAARLVAALAWLAWCAGRLRPAGEPEGNPEPVLAPALIALVFGGAIALIFFENPVIQIHSDGWIHAGIVGEIMARGIPPQDPRYAGLPLNYVWFYNFFIALQSSLAGGDPFHFMALFNAFNMAATLLVSWMVGQALWGTAAATGTALLTALGMNAGVWMLWPLHLVRGLVGETRGWDGIAGAAHNFHINDFRVIFTFSAPFGYMINFYDKFLVGTAVNYAYLMLSVYFAAVVFWFGAGRRAALALAALAACGMLLFHGVVGLSAIPVALGALALTWLLSLRFRGLPSFSRIVAFAAATLAGTLAAAPYTWSISRGWSAEKSGLRHSYFLFDPNLVWTLVAGIAITALLARRPLLDGLRERRGDVTVLACFVLGMILFACVVHLPLGNHAKFVYETFLPLALVGGVSCAPAWRTARRRYGAPLAAAALALLFLVNPLLTLRGYLIDPGGETTHVMHLSPGEHALYDWIAERTPPDAVFVDAEMRDYVMVLGRRQLLLGTRAGPELAAFPADGVHLRREVLGDLYGDQRELDRDMKVLAALGRPVYVLFRAEDHADGRRPADVLAASAWFERVYDADGFVVYHMRPPQAAADSESRP